MYMYSNYNITTKPDCCFKHVKIRNFRLLGLRPNVFLYMLVLVETFELVAKNLSTTVQM